MDLTLEDFRRAAKLGEKWDIPQPFIYLMHPDLFDEAAELGFIFDVQERTEHYVAFILKGLKV